MTGVPRVVLLSLCGTIAFAGACRRSAEPPAAATGSAGVTTHHVGVVLPLKAGVDGAEYGENELNGLRLAADELKTEPGYEGHVFELLVEDDAGDPVTAVAATRRLLSKNVPLVIGSLLSSSAKAQAPVLEAAHVVTILPGASDPELRNAGDYIFRVWPSDDLQGRIAADTLRKRGVTRASILYTNNAYGQGLTRAFTESFEQAGGKVIASESYEPNQATVSFRTQIAKIGSQDVEVIYLVSYPKEVPIILRTVWESGFGGGVFGTEAFETAEFGELAPPAGLKTVGPLGGEVLYATAATPGPDDAVAAAFREAYTKRYGKAPGITADFAYDALKLVAPLLRDHGDNPEAIKAALYKVGMRGATGMITFDRYGDIPGAFVVKRFAKGQRSPVQ